MMDNFSPRLRRRLRRDLADLVGDDESSESYAEPETADDKLSLQSRHMQGKPVSVQWLAKAFKLTRHNVERKLRECPIAGTGEYGNPLYDIPTAASYLVMPRLDIRDYLKGERIDLLPEKFRASYWDSMLKRQKWQREAQHLWSTDEVFSEIGGILERVREHLEQIPDRVERITGLSIDQYKIMQNSIDGVREELYQEIVRLSDLVKVQPQAAEITDDDDLDASAGSGREDLA